MQGQLYIASLQARAGKSYTTLIFSDGESKPGNQSLSGTWLAKVTTLVSRAQLACHRPGPFPKHHTGNNQCA